MPVTSRFTSWRALSGYPLQEGPRVSAFRVLGFRDSGFRVSGSGSSRALGFHGHRAAYHGPQPSNHKG